MKQHQNFRWPVKTMGTDYYPEQWDRSLWEPDLSRMLDVGISVIRIAEFSWNLVEPEEGRFTFDFYDEFLSLCEKKGMKVIFGTPTATPPAWLTTKYPEVLNCDISQLPYRHGSRRHYNYNSPVYRKAAARIVEQEAAHYGKSPVICGWQIDNELNCETADFYSEADNAAFRVFLQKKYGSLQELNRAWGTAFWNQTYTDWSQVHVIRRSVSGGVNPHQHLDYLRFVSESCLSFAALQADIIRKYKKPGDFITTNGMFAHLDNHRLAHDILDVYTFDTYPDFAFSLGNQSAAAGGAAKETPETLFDRDSSRNLTRVRSICPHFGIMEQQAGPGGWTVGIRQPSPRPGQIELWAMQSVAHGADYIGFFRWRTACFGTEIYWHGILDYDSRDNRRLREVKDFYRKFRTLDEAAGADYRGFFVVVQDYDNEFDAELDEWHGAVAAPSGQGIFLAAQKLHTPYNVVSLNDKTDAAELAPYPVLLYPHPVIMTEARAKVLEAYVAAGGTLVVGCRAGLKDKEGHCVMMPQPGLLSDLTGTTVEDFGFSRAEEEIRAQMADGTVLPAPVFQDILQAQEGTRVLATYTDGYFKGAPALTEYPYGKGSVLHFGSTFCRENMGVLLRYLNLAEPLQDIIAAPGDVELALQEKDGKAYLFVLNFMGEPRSICLKREVTFMYTGEKVQGEIQLPAYGTAVYSWKEHA